MKLNTQWLREYLTDVDFSFKHLPALANTLNLSGLAVESITPCADDPDDFILSFELTPNRGGCFSVQGIAREMAAILNKTCQPFLQENIHFNPKRKENVPEYRVTVLNQAPKDCPYYTGCVITHLDKADKTASTPDFLKRRLEISGMKSIHPLVDVMNYVMLETGQPLHAFDLNKLCPHEKVFNAIIRRAKLQEKLVLLDQKTVELNDDVLVIADSCQPHAMAGIMGGFDSAVDLHTQAVFIESAFFNPQSIAGRSRAYGLETEASQRFERGVDYTLPVRALYRALAWLQATYPSCSIYPILEQRSDSLEVAGLLKRSAITLEPATLKKTLGITLPVRTIETILKRLNIDVSYLPSGTFTALPPSYRFDIRDEIDLVEEIARLYTYEAIHKKNKINALKLAHKKNPVASLSPDRVHLLTHQGLQEIITYSFISAERQRLFDPLKKPRVLRNPLSSEMEVMRTSLWPGLIHNLQYHLNRQKETVRFFEQGRCFIASDTDDHAGNSHETDAIGGVLAGNAHEKKWLQSDRPLDFFDLKQVISTFLSMKPFSSRIILWKKASHPALHPGQTAEIFYQSSAHDHDKIRLGICGALHPRLQRTLGIRSDLPVFLFELEKDKLRGFSGKPAVLEPLSLFPSVRRDISVMMDCALPWSVLERQLLKNPQTQPYLKSIEVFDSYEGPALKKQGKKSLSVALTFSAPDKTFSEADIQSMMQAMIQDLQSIGVTLRDG